MQELSDFGPLRLANGKVLSANDVAMYFLSPNVWDVAFVLQDARVVRVHRAHYKQSDNGPVSVPDMVEVVAHAVRGIPAPAKV
jgi:hypothetical protein